MNSYGNVNYLSCYKNFEDGLYTKSDCLWNSVEFLDIFEMIESDKKLYKDSNFIYLSVKGKLYTKEDFTYDRLIGVSTTLGTIINIVEFNNKYFATVEGELLHHIKNVDSLYYYIYDNDDITTDFETYLEIFYT